MKVNIDNFGIDNQLMKTKRQIKQWEANFIIYLFNQFYLFFCSFVFVCLLDVEEKESTYSLCLPLRSNVLISIFYIIFYSS